jgi:hypothetical protein
MKNEIGNSCVSNGVPGQKNKSLAKIIIPLMSIGFNLKISY